MLQNIARSRRIIRQHETWHELCGNLQHSHIRMLMQSLWNWRDWRTILVGFVLGYYAAWGMHRAITLYDADGNPRHVDIHVSCTGIR